MVRPWVSRSQGKSSAVSLQHSADSSASEKLVVGQRRRRSLGTEGRKAKAKIAFENLAKSMLRYLDNCNEVKVGITELQERVEVPEQIRISTQQVARQAMNEDGQKKLEVFWKEEGKLFVACWARWEAQRKGSVDLERRCSDISREIQRLNKRQEIYQSAIEGKLRGQDRASERLQDQIIEEIKDLESTKTEEALQIAEKEHDLWKRKQTHEDARKM